MTPRTDALFGKMGVLVQPRTKGPGHSLKRSRAFYARKKFVAIILGDPGLAPGA